jgi:N-acyl homoserine lactone hydrolase
VTVIVNSHLHFDHCGQNRSMPWAPVCVQRQEYDLIQAPRFTISEWARIDLDRLRLIDGDETLAEGVRIVATPGHTPGHQSLVVEHGGVTTLIAGQPCYTCAEFAARDLDPADAHDESWIRVARDSLARLHSFEPDVVHLAHDRHVHRRTPT